MKGDRIVMLLDRLKGDLPINEVLKKELRKSFKPKRKFAVLKRFAAIAAAVILIYATVTTFNSHFVERANATSLKISNYVSLVDLEGDYNQGIAEYNGIIYAPVAGEGLYVYDQAGHRKLYDGEVDFVSVSKDGRKLIFSTEGSLKVYDIQSNNTSDLLEPENETVYYEHPSWSDDGQKVVFVKKVFESREIHGFVEKESGIYDIELGTKRINKITDGSFPSYTQSDDAIVFERDYCIILRKLKDGSEQTVDSGRFPSASPDGKYIAYVKTEEKTEDLDISKNAKLQASIADVWIANSKSFVDKKQVTGNYPAESIDQNEWLKSIRASDIPQVLSMEGEYDYYNPAWSSDSNSLYILKNHNRFKNANESMSLVRIDLTQKKISAKDTVERYLQALIMQDDDYAKSLMNSSNVIAVFSNPKAVGYQIMTSNQEGGKTYIDAEMIFQDNADPYFQVNRSRYHLLESDNGYKIDRIENLYSEEIIGKDDGIIYYTKTDNANRSDLPGQKLQTAQLLKLSDIPAEYMTEGKHRISCLSYSGEKGSLVFTIQGSEDSSTLKILSYDLKNKKFELIDSMDHVNVSSLTMDRNSPYASLDYFSQDAQGISKTKIYKLDSRTVISVDSLFDKAEIVSQKSAYWNEKGLIIEVEKEKQRVKYIFNPEKEKLEKFH